MAARQHARASHPRPPAGAAHAAGSLPHTADGPARTPIALPQAGDPHATLAIDRWNNEGGRIYEGIVGATLAGATTAEALPESGFAGLALIGTEPGVPLEGVAAGQRGAA